MSTLMSGIITQTDQDVSGIISPTYPGLILFYEMETLVANAVVDSSTQSNDAVATGITQVGD